MYTFLYIMNECRNVGSLNGYYVLYLSGIKSARNPMNDIEMHYVYCEVPCNQI